MSKEFLKRVKCIQSVFTFIAKKGGWNLSSELLDQDMTNIDNNNNKKLTITDNINNLKGLMYWFVLLQI